ncbi:NAD(P)/FAD-dependent oxidoreductase [Streptomyces sp. PSAA01]|uniref:NAD(P)/FAD-dependent oxidoreductase n=1 Tax=Streptomyces sp. PSAA01 TaxID=2912762 RepID=UPI001F1C8E67|nr:FAD-dependent oxidoreductase [Streptomyces sp. PSAA01]MCG0287425.1 FAD-dependent oxidoreductase [Streptomyces sp. PSAA01]
MESNRERSPRQRRRVVIVGGGMAGTRLAQQLAVSAGEDSLDVTIIGEEPHPAYNRVLLAEVLAGRYAPEVIALPGAGDGVRRLSGVRVVRVDRPTAEVLCDDGRRVPYDALVLATGSNPVLPPLRGLFEPGGRDDLHALPDGVHAFRTMDDCLALGAAVRPGTRAVVIGGGLLGVSAARALAQRGAQVVLAHQGEHLMERQLDPGASRLLRRHMAALGVEIHTECRARGLRTDGQAVPTVHAVELADGYALEADLVVLACGVRPRVGLARAAGLEVARGIVVDDELRTSDPRVFAIGDCAEHDGVVYGLAGAAQEQADVLARLLSPTPPLPEPRGPRPLDPHEGSALEPAQGSAPDLAPGDRVVGDRPAEGAPTSGSWGRDGWAQPGHRAAPGDETAPRYHGTRTLTRLTLTAAPGSAGASASGTDGPLDLAAFGTPTPAPGDDVIHLTDATRNTYRKVVVRGDRLLGGILLGDLGTVGALARAWEGDEPLPVTPLLHLLTNDGGS